MSKRRKSKNKKLGLILFAEILVFVDDMDRMKAKIEHKM